MGKKSYYNVAIVGGGISGSALLYTLAKYTELICDFLGAKFKKKKFNRELVEPGAY